MLTIEKFHEGTYVYLPPQSVLILVMFAIVCVHLEAIFMQLFVFIQNLFSCIICTCISHNLNKKSKIHFLQMYMYRLGIDLPPLPSNLKSDQNIQMEIVVPYFGAFPIVLQGKEKKVFGIKISNLIQLQLSFRSS